MAAQRVRKRLRKSLCKMMATAQALGALVALRTHALEDIDALQVVELPEMIRVEAIALSAAT